MSHPRLQALQDATPLQTMDVPELGEVADEIRDVLCNLLTERSAHFASNLGVVELCLALHSVFDFRSDRLVWDTGHQIYPHKLITGRYNRFSTMRTKGGLMGYPNPLESEYDLFVTGHAGCSVSSALGLRSGDELLDQSDRYSVAVIGDGAFPSGIVYEAMNNAGQVKSKMLVVLNDNKMSICPRVGGVASYLDRLRTNPFYTGLKAEVVKILNKVPLFGDPVERFLAQVKEGVKAGMHGGMLFEDLGFRYLGPIDGHDIGLMRKYFKMIKELDGPVLLHVVTNKGHGFTPAAEDPVYFHTPPAFACNSDGTPQPKAKSGGKAFTNFARDAIYDTLKERPTATVMTAAMCQGNKLEPIREDFPKQFFDVGICESHAVAFAAGQAKAGLKPIVAIYSTFMQRSFDQIFQEVALQNLPVTMMLDRAGLAGPDGPTHHGIYDLGYMRLFPNMVVMAPGDARDVADMLQFAMEHDGPCSIRYPKATANEIARPHQPVELGKSELMHWGNDGTIISCGAQLQDALTASKVLAKEGLDVGVVNARFVKPIDEEMMTRVLSESPFVVTVEEAALAGGFGSALLEFAADNQLPTHHVKRLGIPDCFVEHGERGELLADLRLDSGGIVNTCREMSERGVSSL